MEEFVNGVWRVNLSCRTKEDYEALLERRRNPPVYDSSSSDSDIDLTGFEYHPTGSDHELSSSDGYFEISEKQLEKYYKQVEESDGFDVDDFSDDVNLGMIIPINGISRPSPCRDQLSEYAQSALKTYNANNATNYKFLRVLKANSQAVAGIMYYITIQVQNEVDSTICDFQIKVYDGVCDFLDVQICRPKSPTKATTTTAT